MYVTLPSQERVAVPAECRTGGAVKRFIEAGTQIPIGLQQLYHEQKQVADDDRLEEQGAGSDTVLDLVLVIGDAYLLCREGLRETIEADGREILHSDRSALAERDIGDLTQHPVVFDPHRKEWSDERRNECESFAEPFYAAHKQHRKARLETLRQTCQGLDRGSYVISTFNDGFRPMFENWVASCDRHGIDCRAATVLFPMDADADRLARDMGFATFYDGVSYGDLPRERYRFFGDRRSVRTRFIKLAMVQDMLELGYDVLMQDMDMVWLCDPLADLEERAERDGLDFQFMNDGYNPRHQPLYYNSGFVHVRNNAFSKTAWRRIYKNFPRVVHYKSDQMVVNIVISSLRGGVLRTRALPQNLFVNGDQIHQANRKGMGLPPEKWVVHASWTRDMETKVELLKQHGLWYIGGE